MWGSDLGISFSLSHSVVGSHNPPVCWMLRDVKSFAPSHTGASGLESQQIQPSTGPFLSSVPGSGVGGSESWNGQDVGSWRPCSGMRGPVGSSHRGVHRSFLVACPGVD